MSANNNNDPAALLAEVGREFLHAVTTSEGAAPSVPSQQPVRLGGSHEELHLRHPPVPINQNNVGVNNNNNNNAPNRNNSLFSPTRNGLMTFAAGAVSGFVLKRFFETIFVAVAAGVGMMYAVTELGYAQVDWNDLIQDTKKFFRNLLQSVQQPNSETRLARMWHVSKVFWFGVVGGVLF